MRGKMLKLNKIQTKGVYAFIALFAFLLAMCAADSPPFEGGVGGGLMASAIGSIAILTWALFASRQILRWEIFGSKALERFLFGWFTVIGFGVALLVGIYFLVGISAVSAFVWVSIVTIGIVLVPEAQTSPNPSFARRGDSFSPPFEGGVRGGQIGFIKGLIRFDIWFALFLFADLCLLSLLILARTDEALVSPWLLFNGEIFVLFLIATFVYIVSASRYSTAQVMAMGIFHTFIALSVSSIIYGIGFGFDPFIHRAAEEAMALDGFIEPRQLLYIGQYTFVTALHKLTSISINTIDIWYVPIFASVSLPLTTYFGLREGFGTSAEKSKTWWLAILSYPFMLLTFSVPFTFTYVVFLNILFAGFALFKSAASSPHFQGGVRGGYKIVSNLSSILIATAMLALSLFHPLLCVPLGFWILIRAFQSRWIKAIASTLIGLSLPILLTYYQIAQGQAVHLSSLWQNSEFFFHLFKNPFYDPYPFIPIHLEVLYEIRYWFPYALVVIGSIVMIVTRKKFAAQWKWLLSLIVGLMVAIYLTSTLFVYKDIIIYEQSEFALRLLHVWYGVFVLPCIVGLSLISKRAVCPPPFQGGVRGGYKIIFIKGISILTVTSLIVIAWYFSYPQFNLQYPFYSPGVSASDVEAVNLIDEHADGDYLVLSNQLTSAAALQEFGFDQYVTFDEEEILRYAIPTGGVLYPYYTRLFAAEDPELVLAELFESVEVDSVYLLTHTYWDWTIPSEGLEEQADEIFSNNLNDIIIYQFNNYLHQSE